MLQKLRQNAQFSFSFAFGSEPCCISHTRASEGFFPGLGFFSSIFPGGARSGEIWFFPLETKKTTFFAKNFKIQEGAKAPLPTPMITYVNQWIQEHKNAEL